MGGAAAWPLDKRPCPCSHRPSSKSVSKRGTREPQGACRRVTRSMTSTLGAVSRCCRRRHRPAARRPWRSSRCMSRREGCDVRPHPNLSFDAETFSFDTGTSFKASCSAAACAGLCHWLCDTPVILEVSKAPQPVLSWWSQTHSSRPTSSCVCQQAWPAARQRAGSQQSPFSRRSHRR